MIKIEFYDHRGSSIYTLQGVEGIPGIVDKKRFLLEKGKEPIDYLKFYGITKDNIVRISFNTPPEKPKYRMVFYELTGDEDSINRLTIATDPVMEDHGVYYIVPELDDFFKKEMSDLMICRTTHSLVDIHPDIPDVILSWDSNHIKWLRGIPWKPEYMGRYVGGIELNTKRLKELISRGLILRPCEPTDRVRVNIPIHGKYNEYTLTVKEYIDGVNLRKHIKGLIPFKPAIPNYSKSLEVKPMKEKRIKEGKIKLSSPIGVIKKNEGRVIHKKKPIFLVECVLNPTALAEIVDSEGKPDSNEIKRIERECPSKVLVLLRSHNQNTAPIRLVTTLGRRGKRFSDIRLKQYDDKFIYTFTQNEIKEISESEYYLKYYKRNNIDNIPVVNMMIGDVYQRNLVTGNPLRQHIHRISLRQNPTAKQRANRKWHDLHRTKKYYVKEDNTDKMICVVRDEYYKNPQTGEDKLVGQKVARIWKSQLYEHDSIYSSKDGWRICSKSKWKQLREFNTFVPPQSKEKKKKRSEPYYGKRAFRTLQHVQRHMRVGIHLADKSAQIAADRVEYGDIIHVPFDERKPRQSKKIKKHD